jgi:geranylgeranyl pyrophosphate synthase
VNDWRDTRRRLVDAALQRFLPAPPAAPDILCDAMRYSVMAGGKRLRPLLVLAAAEAAGDRVGLDPARAADLALPAACALVIIHTYSVVHD